MTVSATFDRTAGVVLMGTHRWSNSVFDRLPPRPLMPVAHRPLLSYALSWLQEGGVHDAIVCANRDARGLQSRLIRYVPDEMTVSYQQDAMPRGAAGALRDAAMNSEAETFVVTDGTSIPNIELRHLLAAHEESGASVTVVGYRAPSQHGSPALQVPNGIYVFGRDAIDAIPHRGFYDIKENLLPQLHRAGKRVVTHAAASATPRVLDAASYLAVNEWVLERVVAAEGRPNKSENYLRRGHALIHRDALVAEDAMLVGPILVEAGVSIKSGAVVVGPATVGRDVTIESGALVSRSAIWRRCVLGEKSIADRCILSDDTIVEARTQTFRAVMAADQRWEFEALRDRPIQATDSLPLELLRRMGKALSGGTWSRSPAA